MLRLTGIIAVLVVTLVKGEQIERHCGDFKAQQILDIDMLFGKWFATELIYHDREEPDMITLECPVLSLEELTHNNNKKNEYREQHPHHTENQEDVLDWDELMEPLIKVWREQKNNGKYRHGRTTTQRPNEDLDDFKKQTLHRLRLIWKGDADRVEYSLRYNDSRPGYWMSFGSQTQTLLDNHTPFVGTIQVLKAIRSQMVLTFCHISKKHDFFTVVISREPWVNRTDLMHIHQMLERKQLPVRHFRSMCMEYRNSSSFVKISRGMILISFLLVFLFQFINS